MTTQTQHPIDYAAVEGFAGKVAADQNAGVAGVLAYIGDRLGLWKSLAAAGPVTPTEFATATGLSAQYLSEWLAAQAAAEYLRFDPGSGTFHLPAEHALVLADDDSPAALAGGFEFQAGAWADADRIADLFVTGGGIPWGDRDRRLVDGAARFFGPLYRENLVQHWLASLDGVAAQLVEGARVLDVGCGQGFATVLMAAAYPNSTFVGIDPDESSLAVARRSATGARNVTFEQGHAEGPIGDGWDLVCFFDSFHHVGNPGEAARRARVSLAETGTLMLVEPLSADALTENLDAAGPLYYGPSTIVCLPDALSQRGGAALGAQAGPTQVIDLLADADFSRVRIARRTEFNLVIEAKP